MFPMSSGYADHELSPATFYSVAGAVSLGAVSAMSYYADPDDNYRVPGFMATAGDVGVFTDLRVQVALAAFLGAGWLSMTTIPYAGLLSAALNVAGFAGAASFFASEGQRAAEGEKYLDLFTYTLPALPGQTAPVVELAAVESINEVA